MLLGRSLLILAAVSSVALAQDPTPGTDLPTDAKAMSPTKMNGVLFIPVLGAGPTFGLGGGGAAAMVFRMDSGSPRSAIGVGGLLAERSSWMVSLGGRAYFQRGDWNTSFGIAQYNVDYRFFGIGNDAGNRDHSVILRQDGNADVIEGLHRVVGPLFAGLRYRIDGVDASLAPSDRLGPFNALMPGDSTVWTSALGAASSWDTRDDDVSPRSGTFAQGALMYARTWLGGDRAFNSYDVWINHYIPVKKHDVLAVRATACGAGDAAPLWQLCLFGAQNDLRGYVAGRYRDHAMFAVQAEYRARLIGRWGGTVFGGTGEVAPSIGDVAADHLLVSGGLGLRYLLSQTHRLNVGTDYAFANRTSGAFYFRFGEAF
ncbi:MAG TPA: BamA/TamA family outer membrane protein [Gemmatimonadaceae bacterium]|nr:BamA/TamA family outer membrane protein [Gemmatimonadaceae bacterium]